MAGCKYKFPTKEDVINEMRSAFHTLDCYLEVTATEEEVPDIYTQLLKYINDSIEEKHGT